jgi:hypothetical protein
MNENNQEVRKTMDMVKNCFSKLGLPVSKEIVDDAGVGVLETKIDGESFSLFLEVIFRPASTDLNIKVWFSELITVADHFGVYHMINLINGRLMNIGHLAVNLSNGAIFLLSSLDVCENHFSTKQIEDFFVRLMIQGMDCFALVLKQVNTEQCPLRGIQVAIDEMLEKYSKRRKE